MIDPPIHLQTIIDFDLYEKFKEVTVKNGYRMHPYRYPVGKYKSFAELKIKLVEKVFAEYINEYGGIDENQAQNKKTP